MNNECAIFDIRSAVHQEIKQAVKNMDEDEFVEKIKKRIYQDFPEYIKKSSSEHVKDACVGITIVFKNGEVVTYTEDEYTDYKYDGKVFVVIRKEQWIGLFNIDAIEYITVGK